MKRGREKKIKCSLKLWDKLEVVANRNGWYVYKWSGFTRRFYAVYTGSCIVKLHKEGVENV